jgi:C4-dicarboxylate-specific signal transduction histidine kinase
MLLFARVEERAGVTLFCEQLAGEMYARRSIGHVSHVSTPGAVRPASSRAPITGVLRPSKSQVAADRVQVQQVLMNLMINSIEAMKAVELQRELTLSRS